MQAGIPLHRLNAELYARGLALENLGDIAYQTIAGAISTGTHGTGKSLGGLATQVTGLRLIAGDGSVIDCSAEIEPEVFHAARVGLGALGIISTVTLRCPPAFNLHAIEAPMPVDTVLGSLDELVDGNDHFEFFWFPHTDWALTKRNNRTDRPLSPRSRWREFLDDMLVSNVGFGALCRLGRLRPSLIPPLLGGCRLPAAPSTWTRAMRCSSRHDWCASTRWSTASLGKPPSKRSTTCAATSSAAAWSSRFRWRCGSPPAMISR